MKVCSQIHKSYAFHSTGHILENETHCILWKFEIKTDHIISARRPDLVIVKKKKRTCQIEDFAVQGNHKVKINESKKTNNHFDFARDKKNKNKSCNIKVTVTLFIISALGTVPKSLKRELESCKSE